MGPKVTEKTIAKKFSKYTRVSLISELAKQSYINFHGNNMLSCASEEYLVQCVYYALKYADKGYQAKSIDKEEILSLVNLVKYYEQSLLDKRIKSLDNPELNIFVSRNMNWAFDYASMMKDLMRTYYIASEIKPSNTKAIDFNKVINKVLGLSIDNIFEFTFLIQYLFIKNYYGFDEVKISDYIDDPELRNKFMNFIDSRSINISNPKQLEDINNWNIVRFYPFIKIADGYIISNLYSTMDIFKSIIYWIAKDYYSNNKEHGIDFPSSFGFYFEGYVSDLLSHYLGKDCFHKIPEGNKPSPDFIVNIDDIKILIEAKSGIMGINAQDARNINWVENINRYVDTTIRKAAKQLRAYPSNDNKTRYKIIITYDSIGGENYIEKLIYDKDDPVFVLGIQVFEQLLERAKYDQSYPKRFFELKTISYMNENKSCEDIITDGFEPKYNENSFLHSYYINVCKRFVPIVNKIKNEKYSPEEFVKQFWPYGD